MRSDDEMNDDIFYECDQKACGDRCTHPICRHTKDISHAVKVEKGEDHGKRFYFEILALRGENEHDN